MRILVTDDQSRRYGRLIQALETLGVLRASIDIVQSANDARERMRASYYDLLILDVLVPLWPDTEPDRRHSLDLMFELQETNDLRKPGRILGITADRSVAKDVEPDFGAHMWNVVEYSDTHDGWINTILNCVRYLQNQQKPKNVFALPSVDLVVVCALAEPELEEILKLPWNWSAPRPIDDLTFVHDGSFEVLGRKYSVCAAAAPRMGMVSTAILSVGLISILKPRLVVMSGICAGVKDKVYLGDVLLADPAWDFQSGKRVKDKENISFSISPHQLTVPALIRSHVEQLRMDKEALAKLSTQFGSDAPGTTRIVIGPVASGSAVLADGEVIEEIRVQHRELVGVEMEIYGLYAAAHASSEPRPLYFALKGVCDFADPDKKDKVQRYAAYASANVLRMLMERFASRLFPSA